MDHASNLANGVPILLANQFVSSQEKINGPAKIFLLLQIKSKAYVFNSGFLRPEVKSCTRELLVTMVGKLVQAAQGLCPTL